MVGGHREGYDPECAWCCGYTASIPHMVDPTTVSLMDRGEAAALETVNRLVGTYRQHRGTGLAHTAILLGLVAGLADVLKVGDNEADQGLVGMVVAAVARIAQLEEERDARRNS